MGGIGNPWWIVHPGKERRGNPGRRSAYRISAGCSEHVLDFEDRFAKRACSHRKAPMTSIEATTPRVRSSRAEVAIYLGVAVATTLGHGGILALPFEVGAMVDGLKLTVSQAGLLAGAELIVFTAVQFVLAPYGARLPLRRVAIIGALLIIIASLASAVAPSVPLFAIARVTAGLGFGLVYSVASIAGVQARVPERAYGLGLGATTVVYAGFLSALPRGGVIVSRFPQLFHAGSGVFVVVAIFALVLLALLPWVPSSATGTSRKDAPLRFAPLMASRRPLSSAAVMVLFSVAVFSIYVYIEQRGLALGVSPQTIGTMMSVIYVASGVAGSSLAALLGRRRGITIPLVSGLIFLGLTCLGTSIASGAPELWLGVGLNWVAWFFLYGYLFALSAAIDPAGRLAIVFGAMYIMAAGLASTIGGFLLQFSKFDTIGYLALGSCLLAALIARNLGRDIEHGRPAP